VKSVEASKTSLTLGMSSIGGWRVVYVR